MAATALSSNVLPWCRCCLRRLAGGQFQQVRGKKRLNTVKVRLLEDIAEFGPQGSVLEVARGRMRNLWFPRKQAQYITREMELKTGRIGVVARDPNFNPIEARLRREEAERKEAEAAEKEAAAAKKSARKAAAAAATKAAPTAAKTKPTVEEFTPQRAIELLEQLLPPRVRFYRSTELPSSTTLQGAVSKSEIVTALSTIAAAKNPKEGSKISLSSDSISISGIKGEAVDKIGKYELKVRVEGSGTVVTRELLVTREDEDDVPSMPLEKETSTNNEANTPTQDSAKNEIPLAATTPG